MADYTQDAGMGFGQIAPRLFSIVTVFAGILLLTGTLIGEPSRGWGIFVLLMGIHGVFTNTKKVGFIRKILAWTSGAAGAVFVINVVMQIVS